MNKQKKILLINLTNKTVETKSFSGLNNYIGGVGIGLKLFQMYEEKNPVVFAIGPLNGLFPYASKTAIILQNEGNVEDIYLGGSLSTRIKFLGVDAIIIFGESEEKTQLDIREGHVGFRYKDTLTEDLGLPGKKSTISITRDELLLDGYFTTKENILGKILYKMNLFGIVITGTKNIYIKNFEKYTSIYQRILQRQEELTVRTYRDPSCSGCPMGCRKSKEGEIGGNILLHSLVACEFAENIYSDIGVVFSCLNVLGYDYTHEDIENLPKLIQGILK